MSSHPAFARIRWPAILHYDGQPELACIASHADWQSAADLQHHIYHARDRLIDADGALYTLTHREKNGVLPQPSGQHVALDEVLELVRAHLAREGHACIAKLYAPSISAAIAMTFDEDRA